MSYEEQVNEVIGQVTKNDEGKLVFPDGVDEGLKFAATAEIRRRDTFSAWTKDKDTLAVLQAENSKMEEAWAADISSVLTEDQQQELKELKHTDPDKWRKKLNEYEQAGKTSFEERKQKVKESAKKETELERRTRVLDEYNEANPEHPITQEVIDNDLPPRMYKKFTDGEITFDEFIAEAGKFLTTGKVVGGPGDKPTDEPDLSKQGGNERPTQTAVEEDVVKSYGNEVY